MALSSAARADVERWVGGMAEDKAIGGPYEGASQFDRSVALWNPPLQSADADMLPEKGTLDARVRDMQRNDGYVQTGQMLHRDGIVGGQYMLNSRPEHTVLGLDEVWAEEFQQEVEAKFTLAAESEAHWMDAARTNTFTSMVRLAVGVFTSTGETLAFADWIRETNRPFKTAIQFIDTDRLSTPWDKMGAEERVRGGILQDRRGAPKGYYIRDAHASDVDRWSDAMTWTYIPATKPWGRKQILHIKEQMRVDQSRGVADMVAGLKETRIAKKFRDITLQQAVVSAMYAASIESDLPSEAVFAQMGSGNITSAGAAAAQYAGDYLGAISEYAGSAKHMQIDGIRIPHFFPGTRLQVKQVGAPGGVGQEFEASLLRYLAGILGVSYEELSRDYTKTNYSSARAGMVNTWKFMQSRKKLVADQTANFVYQLWLEEQLNMGGITSMPRNAPNFYEGLNKEAYCGAEWIGAARGQIDELKETQASILKIKNGLSTHEDELAKLGKDWRKVYAQMEREKKERERRGIELVEDNAINAASGTPSEANDGSATEK
jgi:lambda family phage portal protein